MTDIRNTLLAALTIKNGMVIACNALFTELIGFTEREIVNKSIDEKLIIIDAMSPTVANLSQLLSVAIANEQGSFARAEIMNQCHYAVPVQLHCIYNADGTFQFYLRLLHNKYIDPITELPNGWAITSRVTYLLKHTHLTLKNLTLIIIGVDNFSTINFRYSYHIGDQYLLILAKKLQAISKGLGFVIRFDNANFGILLEDYHHLSTTNLSNHIHQFCETLCVSLAAPIKISTDLEISKSFSIGVSSLGIQYDSYHSMEIAAKTALYEARKYSILKYCIAIPQQKADLLSRKLIIDEFPKAILQQQIKVYYQPQYNLNTGQLIGFEALSRWRHDDLGNISPDLFVAIAEDIGLHFEFDLWVFERVCLQLVTWYKDDILAPRIAINVSFKTMEMSSFTERIQSILLKTHCPTELLEFEVTETSSINNTKMLYANVLKVKELGISIAMDDFGSGYASLSLIRSFHHSLDLLKLDRSLIDKICHTELDRHFVKHIIDFGKILNVKVLAEGVETQQQLQLLIELGCDYAQGYYFSKALNKEDTVQLMCNENVKKDDTVLS